MSGTSHHVLAYYFPQFHRDPRNDRWHGPGWTEWDLVDAARPRFPGHRQPIVPAWGRFDEADPEWGSRQIALAAEHGITGFLFDWYWYEDGSFLDRALMEGFLAADNVDRLSFALMWANHDWIDIHPAGFRNAKDVLARGAVDAATFDTMTELVIRKLFAHPSYLRIDNLPFFSIYDLSTFVAGLGGVAAARQALDGFRGRARAAGFEGIHVNGILRDHAILRGEASIGLQMVEELGLSSVGSYTWWHYYLPTTFPTMAYEEAFACNVEVWERYRASLPVPYHPNVSMGWDASPRTAPTDGFAEGPGYPYMALTTDNTPQRFREALVAAARFLEDSEQAVLTINAWNEWTEGSYLLPDETNGTAYLEAVRDVFGAAERSAGA